MMFAPSYFCDPAEAGRAEGEFRDWLAPDAEFEEAGTHVYGPVSIRRASLRR